MLLTMSSALTLKYQVALVKGVVWRKLMDWVVVVLEPQLVKAELLHHCRVYGVVARPAVASVEACHDQVGMMSP